jgi:hypothetical protein
MSTRHPTRREEFREEINEMLENSPYKDDVNLHRLYCMGLLRELLLYSAVDLMEVRERIRYLAERDNSNK